jgi:hypothetical protein
MSGWQERGRCATLNPADADRLFFSDGRTPHEAIRMCQSCPVQPQCYKAGRSEEFGVWGAAPAGGRTAGHAA